MVIYIAMVTQQLKPKVEYARIHDIPVVGWWLCVVEQQLTSKICVCECEGLPCVVILVPLLCKCSKSYYSWYLSQTIMFHGMYICDGHIGSHFMFYFVIIHRKVTLIYITQSTVILCNS